MIIIENQNRNRVVKCSEIRRYGEDILCQDDTVLGKYSTVEKSKKVYNMILDFIGGDFDYSKNIGFSKGVIFRMPKDNEL